MTRSGKDSKIVDFVKRWRMEWALATVATYLVALGIVIFVFPDVSNLWVSVFVLVSGFTAGLTTLSDLLVNAEAESTKDQDADGVL